MTSSWRATVENRAQHLRDELDRVPEEKKAAADYKIADRVLCPLETDANAGRTNDTPRMGAETRVGKIGIIGAGHIGQAFAGCRAL